MDTAASQSRTTSDRHALQALGVHLWEVRLDEGLLKLDAGARRLLGLGSSDEPIPISSLYLHTHAEDGPGLFEAIDTAAKQRKGFCLKSRLKQADGSTRWWELHGEACAGESERDLVVAGWMRDVHDERSQQMLSERLDQDTLRNHRLATIEGCADSVAHEFKNVLQIIRGYVSFAKKTLAEDSDAYTDLEQALLATDRASDVAHQLLATARSEDDELEVCDVNELMSEMTGFLRPILGAEIEVAVAVSVEPVMVTGIEASIRQMLINLCLNARDAMPTGGRLLLRAEQFSTTSRRNDIGRGIEPGDYARIYITDNGHGIEADQLQRLFDPYFTTKQTEQGTGLGLTVVRQLAESCGGAVAAHSEHGVGTTFTLFLPLQPLNRQQHRESHQELKGDLLLVGEETAQSIGALVDAGWRVHTHDTSREGRDPTRAATDFAATLVKEGRLEAMRGDTTGFADDEMVIMLTGFDPQSFLVEPLGAETDALLADPIDTGRLYAILSDRRRPPTAAGRAIAGHAGDRATQELISGGAR